MPPAHGWDYTVDFHRLFPALAAKAPYRSCRSCSRGVALNPELNGGDGIHPNAAGARLIADTVWPYLESLVKREAGITAR